MLIVLSDLEMKVATYIGKQRNANDIEAGLVQNKRSSDTGDEINIQGFAAELAFCRHFNLFPDYAVEFHGQIEDCVLQDGRTVDVKQTKYESGRLIVPIEKEQKKCDIYYLVTGTMPNFWLRGYATKEEVFRDESIDDLGYGPSYMIEQKNLHQLEVSPCNTNCSNTTPSPELKIW